MPIYKLKGPDGQVYTVKGPEGATAEELGQFVSQQSASPATGPAPQSSQAPGGIKGNPQGIEEIRGGLASAPINLYLGAKQLVNGSLSPVDQDVLSQNREAAAKAPVSSFASGVGTFAPVAMIPGGNSLIGAALSGGAYSGAQPIAGDESRLQNAAMGAVGGAAGQKLGTALQSFGQGKVAAAENMASANSVRDASLKAAQEAGYNIPRSLYNPSFLSNRLESIGGKAAIKQEASLRNQQVTNSLARQSLGLEEGVPLSAGNVENVRRTAYAPYREVADLPQRPGYASLGDQGAKADLEALKQARNDATAWYNAYNRSASPEDLAKAKMSQGLATNLEQSLETRALEQNRPELLNELRDARKTIAKTYDVNRALNPATGDVSARVMGRLYDKGKPLSDGLDVIGRTQTAFPQVMGDAAKTMAPGVSKSEALASMLMGTAGTSITGSPKGILAAGIPLLSHPARALSLSKIMQSTPSYDAGAFAKALSRLSPEEAAIIARSITSASQQ